MNEELGFDNSGGINNEVTNGVDNKSSEDYSQFAIPDSEQHKEDNELETDVFEASFDEQTLEEAKKNNKKKKHDKALTLLGKACSSNIRSHRFGW